MEFEGQEQLLYQMVKNQLGASPTLPEIERLISAASGILSLTVEVSNRVVARFGSELAPPPSFDTIPRLFVDWGELPSVGRQVSPEFSLLCPHYHARPDVHIRVHHDLDHNPDDPQRRLQSEEEGLWIFHVPFRMTSEGMDCRPGQYLIDVEVTFREVPQGLPRFFRCTIRLTVPGLNDGVGGVLEIDGDGQSMINLQGHSLKQFSRVVLRGGSDSVINLQGALGNNTDVAEPETEKPVTTFEYKLKVNNEKQNRLPTVTNLGKPRAFLDAAGFFFDDGRRTLVLTRSKITFGRNRDNDVVLRFLPHSSENDGHSQNISRTHFLAELTPEGIELRDESRSGMEVNYSVVRERYVVAGTYAGDHIPVELGVTGTVPKKFQLEMLMFAPDRRKTREELEFWDELYCELVGGRLSRSARQALDVGIDAVRYDRTESLAGEECYVHLLREAIIGNSPTQSSILLKESGPQAQAKLLYIDRSFWLEVLPCDRLIKIDGVRIAAGSLVPLVPGMQLQFGNEMLRFDKPAQLYLN